MSGQAYETLGSNEMNGLIKTVIAASVLVMLSLVFVGCGSQTDEGTTGPVSTDRPPSTSAAEAPAIPEAMEEAVFPEVTAAPAAPAATALVEAVEGETVFEEVEAAMMEAETTTTGGDSAYSASDDSPYQPVSLSAGEVNDNQQWREYLEYLDEYQGPPVHEIDVSERYIITVRDNQGRPLPNARVQVTSGETQVFEGLTFANGQTLFFALDSPVDESVESFQVSAEKDGASRSLDFIRGEETSWELTLDTEASYPGGVPLDVLFLLDSTGSMSDEINQIKDTLLSISARIADLPSQPDLRFGMVSYRDRGDEYVTRLFDFDQDVQRFSDTIRGVQADAGGDAPESLNEALHVAVHRPEWRAGDAIRLVFLLADAPPHLDYPQDYDYAVEMVEARSRGIKIFSVASSGLDAQGEYIFRQIAQHTMGRFIFILYSSQGGSLDTPHNVDEYTVERLDDLVVRLVQEELAALAG